MLNWLNRVRAARMERFATAIRRRHTILQRPAPGQLILETLGIARRYLTLTNWAPRAEREDRPVATPRVVQVVDPKAIRPTWPVSKPIQAAAVATPAPIRVSESPAVGEADLGIITTAPSAVRPEGESVETLAAASTESPAPAEWHAEAPAEWQAEAPAEPALQTDHAAEVQSPEAHPDAEALPGATASAETVAAPVGPSQVSPVIPAPLAPTAPGGESTAVPQAASSQAGPQPVPTLGSTEAPAPVSAGPVRETAPAPTPAPAPAPAPARAVAAEVQAVPPVVPPSGEEVIPTSGATIVAPAPHSEAAPAVEPAGAVAPAVPISGEPAEGRRFEGPGTEAHADVPGSVEPVIESQAAPVAAAPKAEVLEPAAPPAIDDRPTRPKPAPSALEPVGEPVAPAAVEARSVETAAPPVTPDEAIETAARPTADEHERPTERVAEPTAAEVAPAHPAEQVAPEASVEPTAEPAVRSAESGAPPRAPDPSPEPVIAPPFEQATAPTIEAAAEEPTRLSEESVANEPPAAPRPPANLPFPFERPPEAPVAPPVAPWTPIEERRARPPQRRESATPPRESPTRRPAEPAATPAAQPPIAAKAPSVRGATEEEPATPTQWLARLGRAFGPKADESARTAPARRVEPLEKAPTGQPISMANRELLEPLVGTDVGSVRVHEGPTASQAAAEHQADALTVGDQIVLGAGHQERDPETAGLLAHELFHVARRRRPRFVPPVLTGKSPGNEPGRPPFRPAAQPGGHRVPSERGPSVSPTAEEEAMALVVEAAAVAASRERDRAARQGPPPRPGIPPSRAGEPPSEMSEGAEAPPPWGTLPAPWQPIPGFPSDAIESEGPTAAPGIAGPNRAGVWPVSSSPPVSAPQVQRAETARHVPEHVAEGSHGPGHASESATKPDLDALAKQVYTVLKRRLANERRRAL